MPECRTDGCDRDATKRVGEVVMTDEGEHIDWTVRCGPCSRAAAIGVGPYDLEIEPLKEGST